jgi:hypothetical protein
VERGGVANNDVVVFIDDNVVVVVVAAAAADGGGCCICPWQCQECIADVQHDIQQIYETTS